MEILSKSDANFLKPVGIWETEIDNVGKERIKQRRKKKLD